MHFRFLRKLVDLITNFNTGRTILMVFDWQQEAPVPLLAGLLQGSLLSPVLFAIEAVALSTPAS